MTLEKNCKAKLHINYAPTKETRKILATKVKTITEEIYLTSMEEVFKDNYLSLDLKEDREKYELRGKILNSMEKSPEDLFFPYEITLKTSNLTEENKDKFFDLRIGQAYDYSGGPFRGAIPKGLGCSYSYETGDFTNWEIPEEILNNYQNNLGVTFLKDILIDSLGIKEIQNKCKQRDAILKGFRSRQAGLLETEPELNEIMNKTFALTGLKRWKMNREEFENYRQKEI